jgi:valyl-tRNA synthetase
MQASLPVTAMLARLDAGRVEIAAALPAPDKAATLAVAGVTVYLPLAGLVDLDAERKRMQGELDNIDKQVQRIATNLATPASPAKPRQRDRARAAQTRRTAREAGAGGRAAGGVVEIERLGD